MAQDTARPRLTLLPQPDLPADPGVEQRLIALEQQLDEQDRALRRVLTLLVEWVENDGLAPARPGSH